MALRRVSSNGAERSPQKPFGGLPATPPSPGSRDWVSSSRRSPMPAAAFRPPPGAPWSPVITAASSRVATGRRHGATAIIWSTGPTADRPSLTTWAWCVGRTTGKSTKRAGNYGARRTGDGLRRRQYLPLRREADQAERHRNSGSRARGAAPRDASSLALGVLRGFAGALEAGLLALLHAWVAGQHAVLLQYRPHRQVRRAERPGDAVLNRSGLPRHPAAVHHGADTEAFLTFGQLQRLYNDHLQHPPSEVLQGGLVVDHDGALTGVEAHSRDRVLPAPGPVVVRSVIGQ